MVKFNIRPAELQTMIGKLGQFQNSMNNLSNQMRSTAQSLGSTWKDPQYHGAEDRFPGALQGARRNSGQRREPDGRLLQE